ncbi:MAG: DUF5615 family PIN-like protein [Chromatiaceae bacterium]|nr:DUF5615 family PIN-like protein [Chromatiaceae bacterium]
MRILCDVHIPYRLVSWLRERGVDATHMNRVLDGSETPDSAIATFVDANDRVRDRPAAADSIRARWRRIRMIPTRLCLYLN